MLNDAVRMNTKNWCDEKKSFSSWRQTSIVVTILRWDAYDVKVCLNLFPFFSLISSVVVKSDKEDKCRDDRHHQRWHCCRSSITSILKALADFGFGGRIGCWIAWFVSLYQSTSTDDINVSFHILNLLSAKGVLLTGRNGTVPMVPTTIQGTTVNQELGSRVWGLRIFRKVILPADWVCLGGTLVTFDGSCSIRKGHRDEGKEGNRCQDWRWRKGWHHWHWRVEGRKEGCCRDHSLLSSLVLTSDTRLKTVVREIWNMISSVILSPNPIKERRMEERNFLWRDELMSERGDNQLMSTTMRVPLFLSACCVVCVCLLWNTDSNGWTVDEWCWWYEERIGWEWF